jgi:hypothetical protein
LPNSGAGFIVVFCVMNRRNVWLIKMVLIWIVTAIIISNKVMYYDIVLVWLQELKELLPTLCRLPSVVSLLWFMQCFNTREGVTWGLIGNWIWCK